MRSIHPTSHPMSGELELKIVFDTPTTTNLTCLIVANFELYITLTEGDVLII